MQTKDGYLLGLHRIVKKNDFNRSRSHSRVGSGRVEATRGNGGKKVVYLHHGLLMNSEVWVCQTERERCLPFVLADLGYDVWVCVPLSPCRASANNCSLAITVGISTRRSRYIIRQRARSFGSSRWMISRSMIFRTRSVIFWIRHDSLRCRILGSRRGPRRRSRRSVYIRS